jgi:hypothetical protein
MRRRRLEHRHTEGKDVKIPGEDSHVQGKERCLGRNQPCWSLTLDFRHPEQRDSAHLWLSCPACGALNGSTQTRGWGHVCHFNCGTGFTGIPTGQNFQVVHFIHSFITFIHSLAGSCSVAQASLELLDSSNPSASASWIDGNHRCAVFDTLQEPL